MTKFIDALKTMSDEAIKDFIRLELSRDGERLRFEMSGYDDHDTLKDPTTHRLKGTCVMHNQKVLNTFAYLGIYDYTDYLYVDFYKGGGRLGYRLWGGRHEHKEVELAGDGTIEIILAVFKLTVLSNRDTRRRG